MKEEKDEVLKSLLAHLPEDFFGRFKTMGELNSFIDSLFKRGIEKMLEAELSEHLVILSMPLKEKALVIVAMGRAVNYLNLKMEK